MSELTRALSRVSLPYIFARILWGIPALLAVVVISFMVMRFAPGGPFDREKPLPPVILENLRAQYRLDRPMLPVYLEATPGTPQAKEQQSFEQAHGVFTVGPVRMPGSVSGVGQTQLIAYIGQLGRGDFGVSMKYQQVRVNDILARTFPVSLWLGGLAFAVTFLLGMSLGVAAAVRRGTWVDTAAMLVATLGFSMPNFVLGALLILIFALSLKILPPALWEGPMYVVLPVLTLATGPATYIARLTRSGLLESLSEDYIRTARAKGLGERSVVLGHALRNALTPLITVSGPLLATLVTGSFIVEHLFAIPGMGRYFITAVIDRDYPMILGVTVVYAALIIAANIAVDVLYAVADPRVGESS